MSPVPTRRAAPLVAAALVAPRPGCAAAVRTSLIAAPPGQSGKAIARGLLARPDVLLADRCAVLSGGRLLRTGPAPAMLDGSEDAYLEHTAA